MTRYEQGFLTKCAEYGLDSGTAMQLMQKQALLKGDGVRKLVFQVLPKKKDIDVIRRNIDFALESLHRKGKLTPSVRENLLDMDTILNSVDRITPLPRGTYTPSHIIKAINKPVYGANPWHATDLLKALDRA
jgi:hypothetical protein